MEKVYEKLIKGVHKPKKHKFALFLCGSSGTGKTSSKNTFIKDAGLTTTYVNLNLDTVWSITKGEGNIQTIYNEIIERVIREGYSFVYDGTCRNVQTVHLLMNHVKREGYAIKLGMIYANLKITLERLSLRKNQPITQKLAKEIYTEVSRVAKQYMNADEIYLYNNDDTTTLIFYKTHKKIECIHPEMNFYFDVSEYC
jgi:predicted ABC-type ATPase